MQARQGKSGHLYETDIVTEPDNQWKIQGKKPEVGRIIQTGYVEREMKSMIRNNKENIKSGEMNVNIYFDYI